MDMNLGKLWVTAEDKEAWRAVVHGVGKSQTTGRLNKRCNPWKSLSSVLPQCFIIPIAYDPRSTLCYSWFMFGAGRNFIFLFISISPKVPIMLSTCIRWSMIIECTLPFVSSFKTLWSVSRRRTGWRLGVWALPRQITQRHCAIVYLYVTWKWVCLPHTLVRIKWSNRLMEKGMATHSSILALRIPWTEESVGYSPWGHKESDTTKRLSTHT